MRCIAQALTSSLLALMSADGADFTRTFRSLSALPPAAIPAALTPQQVLAPLAAALPAAAMEGARAEAWADWVRDYSGALLSGGLLAEERVAAMAAANPVYVPRNYLLQLAIEAAEKGDYAPTLELLRVLRSPFEEQPGMARQPATTPATHASRNTACALSTPRAQPRAPHIQCAGPIAV